MSAKTSHGRSDEILGGFKLYPCTVCEVYYRTLDFLFSTDFDPGVLCSSYACS